MNQITDVYHLALLPDTDEEAFVVFAQHTGFPLAAVTRKGAITSQHLLREHTGADGIFRYLWIVRWTLLDGVEILEGIGESLWKVRQQLEAQVEITSFARYVQMLEIANRTGR
jgi:hypothetical protein